MGVLGKAQQGAAGVAGGKAARVVCELPGKKTSAKGEEAQRGSRESWLQKVHKEAMNESERREETEGNEKAF